MSSSSSVELLHQYKDAQQLPPSRRLYILLKKCSARPTGSTKPSSSSLKRSISLRSSSSKLRVEPGSLWECVGSDPLGRSEALLSSGSNGREHTSNHHGNDNGHNSHASSAGRSFKLRFQRTDGSRGSKSSSASGSSAGMAEVNGSSAPNNGKLELTSLEVEDLTLTCQASEVDSLSEQEYKLLAALSSASDRLSEWKLKNGLLEALTIEKGCYVYVSKRGMDKSIGEVKYVGPLPGKTGRWFGIALKQNAGRGETDGVLFGERIFDCVGKSGVFCNFKSLRLCSPQQQPSRLANNNNSKASLSGSSSGGRQSQGRATRPLTSKSAPLSPVRTRRVGRPGDREFHHTTLKPVTNGHRTASSTNSTSSMMSDGTSGSAQQSTPSGPPSPMSPPPVRSGDRVVMLDEDTPRRGTVRWVGTLNYSHSNERDMAGVDFDDRIGDGTGMYHDGKDYIRLFSCEHGHGKFIPLSALMREDSYDAPVTSKPEPSYQGSGHQSSHTYGGAGSRRSPPNDNNSDLPKASRGYQQGGEGQPRPGGNHKGWPRGQPQEAAQPHLMDENLRRDILANKVIDQRRISEADVRNLTQPVSVLPSSGDLGLGDLVEVSNLSEGSTAPPSGVIRWIGYVPQSKQLSKLVAGIEAEESIDCGTDGTFAQFRLFYTAPNKALFVYLHMCRRDRRFAEDPAARQDFGSMLSPPITGTVLPPSSEGDILASCGKARGIQGHHNSCYLDASLYCMFAFNTTFDSLLHRPAVPERDVSMYAEIQEVLRNHIVNPLRSRHYVRADSVLKLRTLLDKLQVMTGLMGQEQDPEEFLNALFQKVMMTERFIKLSNDVSCHTYQVLVEKDDRIAFPTVQQLLDRSCYQNQVKFAEMPSVLILQLPRSGRDKVYKKIFPSPTLNITHLLQDAPRECSLCGGLATWECMECVNGRCQAVGDCSYCDSCERTAHQHPRRRGHRPSRLHPTGSLSASQVQASGVPQEQLELFAVLCIETSHYVAFVKCDGDNWVFFDSMADRQGAVNGYNIPAVSRLESMNEWLSEDSYSRIATMSVAGAGEGLGGSGHHINRLLCDGYICFYRSPDVLMYK